MQFRYRALMPDGRLRRGAADAQNEEALIRQLRSQGLFAVAAEPLRTGAIRLSWLMRLKPKSRISPRALVLATAEFARLLEAGLELDAALAIVGRLSGIGALRVPIENARLRVRDGATLSDALRGQDGFSQVYVSLIEAAEYGGHLDEGLRQLAIYLKRDQSVRDSILSALVYPIVLVISAAASVMIILTVVLPAFAPIFAEAHKSLPWSTRLMLSVGTLITHEGWILLLAALAALFWFRARLKQLQFRVWWDGLLLRTPVVGALLLSVDVERFARSLGTLLTQGVALPPALLLVRDGLSNRALSEHVAAVAASLREGEALAPLLASEGLFPDVLIDLVAVGERTGKLEPTLLQMADLEAERLSHRLDRLIALLVPALTIILGVAVGSLVVSLLSALMAMNNLVLH